MKKANQFLRLFRWPNLLMMVTGLLLTRYCILLPLYNSSGIALQTRPWQFALLVLATVFIGAAGYVVNDILDAGLDDTNKPGKNVIGTAISERSAWNLYYALNVIGLLPGLALSYLAGKTELGILFLLIATALYYYSLKYKYLPFWGNFVISLLTAMTVMIVWLFEFFFLKQSATDFAAVTPYFRFINHYVFGYAFLAFFVTFTREVAKDAQDIEGDRRHGCNTLAILLGERRTKFLLHGLFLFSIVMVVIIQVRLFNHFLYLALFLSLVPALAVVAMFRVRKAGKPEDYGAVSNLCKTMLAAGLLSMILLWFPN